MPKKSVAVLDIRSSEVTALVGERGVNGTFIIKSKFTCPYEGYAESELLDVNNFQSAVKQAVNNALSSTNEKVKTFYVGVPDEFTKVENTDKTISFSTAKRVKQSDLLNLKNFSKPNEINGYDLIYSGVQYYVLSDKRRTVNPVGEVSDSLRGKLCFYLCKAAFLECVINAFKPFKTVKEIKFIPSCHAQATYILPEEQRDQYAILLDIGFISSTFSIACGNALAYSEAFSVGAGHIAVYLMSELDVPYEVALSFLKQVNISCKDRVNQLIEERFEGETFSFSASTVREKIREGLDGLCEMIEECRQNYTGVSLDGKTIFVTGDCVNLINGTVQHISERLQKNVEIIAPALPYYDKPQFSSLFSLLHTALNN